MTTSDSVKRDNGSVHDTVHDEDRITWDTYMVVQEVPVLTKRSGNLNSIYNLNIDRDLKKVYEKK